MGLTDFGFRIWGGEGFGFRVVKQKALKLLYQKYADELPPADHPGGPDGVAGEKFLEFFRDLEVDRRGVTHSG